MGTALIIISRLGGALNRNAREAPGPQTLLRGLRRFHDIGLGVTTASKVGCVRGFSRDLSLSRAHLSCIDDSLGHLIGTYQFPVGAR